MLPHHPVNAAATAAFGLFAIASTLLLVPGCGGEPPGSQPPLPLAAAPPPPPPDSMHVFDSTLTRLAADFDRNVDLGHRVPLLYTEQELLWSDLADRLPADSAPTHGLLIDYGLQGDSLRFGFRFATLTPTATPNVYDYTPPDTLLDFWNNGLTPVLAKDWRMAYQYDTTSSSVYYSRVRIRHAAGKPFEPADPLSDASADMMAWENEVKAMYDENAAGHGDSTLYLVVRCIARTTSGDLRHGICYHLRLRPRTGSGFRDLLDDSYDKNALFRMHGCDFGTLCPPLCNTYIEPAR